MGATSGELRPGDLAVVMVPDGCAQVLLAESAEAPWRLLGARQATAPVGCLLG